MQTAVSEGFAIGLGVKERYLNTHKCIQALTMTYPAKIYPEPTEAAGTDSPRALLDDSLNAMEYSDEDVFIPSVSDKKVRDGSSYESRRPRLHI